MSKSKPTAQVSSSPSPKEQVLRAVVVVKSGHLLSECFELTIVDGIVKGVKALSRAPDLNASAVGHGASALWRHVREQTVEALPKV